MKLLSVRKFKDTIELDFWLSALTTDEILIVISRSLCVDYVGKHRRAYNSRRPIQLLFIYQIEFGAFNQYYKKWTLLKSLIDIFLQLLLFNFSRI